MDGAFEITQDGIEVGLMVTSGASCDPDGMRIYSGSILYGQMVLSNSAIVDDEGGSATNALRLFFFSNSEGGGEPSLSYVHPKGFECQWSHEVMLWRSE